MAAISFIGSYVAIGNCSCPFSASFKSRNQVRTSLGAIRHPSRVFCADEAKDVASSELMPRQERRLWMAAVEGRRNVDIQSLARETGLDRRVVLDWLKKHDAKDIPQEYRVAPVQPAGDVSASNASRQRDQAIGPVEEELSVPGMKLKATDRATLERVYDVAQYPSDEMIQSILDITRMPRNKVLAWFQMKRSEDGMREKRKPYRPPFPKRK